jgi:hypothetical protein
VFLGGVIGFRQYKITRNRPNFCNGFYKRLAYSMNPVMTAVFWGDGLTPSIDKKTHPLVDPGYVVPQMHLKSRGSLVYWKAGL